MLVERSQLRTSVKTIFLPHIFVPQHHVYVCPVAIGHINYQPKCSVSWKVARTAHVELLLIGTFLQLAARAV